MEMWCGQSLMCAIQQFINAQMLITHLTLVEMSPVIVPIVVDGWMQTTLSVPLNQELNLLFIYTSPFTPVIVLISCETCKILLDQ